MYAYLRDGTLIEHAAIMAATPGNGGMSFLIDGTVSGSDTTVDRWVSEAELHVIRFDRDTMFDPVPEPGPDDFKIGTRHDDPPLTFTRV